MARADRLMRLMDALRRLPAPVTATRLADETAVSPRQLYRDIATLRAGGALIDGAAGLGYQLTEDPALPPQSFSQLEIEALQLAVQALARIGDAGLQLAAETALARIVATLPARQAGQAQHAVLHSFTSQPDRPPVQIDLSRLLSACWEEEAVRISYRDLDGQETEREIWPLGLAFMDHALILAAHCRMRMAFRAFRVDAIRSLAPTGAHFRPQRVALLREFRESRRGRDADH